MPIREIKEKMIDARELRIGNLAFENGRGVITIDGAMIKWIEERSYRGIEPIPLTEEWLLKFGFEKHITGCFIKGYAEQGELIIFDSSTPVAKANDIKEGEYYYMFHRSAHMLQHVHQLQNLYFALTGNELTLS